MGAPSGERVAAREGRRPNTHGGARQYHTGLRPGDLPPVVLVPGDPARAARIAASWDASRSLEDRREYRSYSGSHHGVPLGVVSTGIGGPSIAIAVEDLARIGVRTLVRVGSSGAVRRGLRGGDLVLTVAAGRFEAASRAYAPSGYPAVADPRVLRALIDAARATKVRFHVGLTATVDTFHRSEGRRGFRPIPRPWGTPSRRELDQLGFLNVEMEASMLLTIANVYRLAAGAVCAIYPDGPRGDPVPRGDDDAIAVATDAAVALSRAHES